MLRWILLTFALLFLPLTLLTVFRSPDWSEWKLALVAGNFGHWVMVVPLAVALIAWFGLGAHGACRIAIVALGVLECGLLLKPALQALSINQTLPAQFAHEFGAASILPEERVFSLGALFNRDPAAVTFETKKYSGDLALNFYRGQRTDGKAASCVVMVHGGGWDSGDRGEFPGVNHWLAREGYAVAAIDYRLAPKAVWPAQRDDVLAALAWLKAHAAELGIDPTRLVLFGRSAGGQIASAVAYTKHDPAIRGLVALYSPHDMHFAWKYARDDDVLKSPFLLKQFLGGVPDTARAAYDSSSAYLNVHSSVPPTLLIHGVIDTLVWYKQSERLDAKLTEAHVPHIFVSLPWATHAFDYTLAGPGGQITTYSLRRFLAAVTK